MAFGGRVCAVETSEELQLRSDRQHSDARAQPRVEFHFGRRLTTAANKATKQFTDSATQIRDGRQHRTILADAIRDINVAFSLGKCQKHLESPGKVNNARNARHAPDVT